MTSKSLWGLAIGAMLLLANTGAAQAEAPYHDLTIAGWMVGNRVAYTSFGNFYAGAFTWAWDGGPVNTSSPLYCLDLLHSFSGTPATWQVTRLVVPPDPSFPPPCNTDHAVWIYYHYGTAAQLATSSDKATRAAAVQVALWEVSHDQTWSTINSGWLSSGTFRWTGATSAVSTQADDILASLYGALDAEGRVMPPRPGYWYQPKDWPDPEVGQGQLGESPVPEPGIIVLLGLGLVAAGGTAWRKRR